MSMKLDGFQPVFQPMMTKTAPAAQAKKPFELPQEREAPAKTDQFADRSNQLSMLEEMLKNSKDQSEQSAESFDDLGKCMTIAARIMNGDSVPQKDHKFLAEKYPELYEQAILMRRINHDPKKYKSLIEDEEEENNPMTDEAAGAMPKEELLGAIPAEESAALSESLSE